MECQEGPQGLEPAGEAAPEGGGGATSVRHVLSIGGPYSPPLWGGDLGFVRGDVQEYGEGPRRFPKADNGSEGGATGGRNLAVGGSREGPLEGSNSVPRNLYLQDSGNIGGVGGVASYLGGM